jgi:hypothetical protein
LLQLGRAEQPGEFQVTLFEAADLHPTKEHTIQVTNLPSKTSKISQSLKVALLLGV